MTRSTQRCVAALIALALAEPALVDPQTYRQQFVDEVVAFADLNRLKIERLHRDVHADCYIPLTIATVIRKDGSVKDISVVTSSTVPVVDRYFRFVIEQAAPYPPLEEHYDPVPEEITITHEFRLDVRLWSDGVSSERPCAPLEPAEANDIDEARAAAAAGDHETALEILVSLAEMHDAQAEHALGLHYFYGLGVEQDYGEAARWFQRSAEQGFADGQSALGLMYASGWGVAQDYDKAREWLRNAAEQGLAEAQAELGLIYLQGYGVEQDYGEALKLFRASADQGNTKAQVSLATMYQEGRGVEANGEEALRWTRIAAEAGDPVAQHNMGASYATGYVVPLDYGEAMSWYRKAADQGYAESQYIIGWMYEQGEGVEPNDEEAMRWYTLAAEQGHPAAEARLASGPGSELPATVVDAIDLARQYLSTKVVLEVAIPFAEMGATVHLGEVTISKKNVRQYKKNFKRRLKAHRDEIRRRGYAKIAGAYTSETTESCARIHSSMGELQGEHVSHVEITQDGFEIEIILVFTQDDEEFRLSNSAIIVEQGIAMVDDLNTDYYFWGIVEDGRITMAPDPAVLEGWPEWAGPPKREDLQDCTIVLERTTMRHTN